MPNREIEIGYELVIVREDLDNNKMLTLIISWEMQIKEKSFHCLIRQSGKKWQE